ncbi:ORF422 [White spot syndrome virus]|uniref:Wsv394 n=3 Tax=White spot syndrome virus TaxID=342409 RepID=Q8VAK8_WSSVS|nr:wsv394 [Shrimp white spot syndrome virus]AFX59771.1 wsv394 [White spot syndrome virus]AAL33396.1 wsv394 [Shrimp white spot syndrome virus]AAL89321.1 WSSV453 [Shrimp white spot syndrome virus]ATU83645.1 ORF422 [White spot syndrome virus]AWQ60519.1 wsv394 [Shrimp white spot syndrome virus]
MKLMEFLKERGLQILLSREDLQLARTLYLLNWNMMDLKQTCTTSRASPSSVEYKRRDASANATHSFSSSNHGWSCRARHWTHVCGQVYLPEKHIPTRKWRQ